MNQVKYSISDNGFVIDNYNQAPTFASFFPGIAGQYGCPMWAFYTNRGQCISSAGVQDKDNAIMEFQPANKAYRQTPLTGFRTFLKVDGKFYEPFKQKAAMYISSGELKLVEENKKLKIRIEVTYFTIANESFPALARSLKITNLAKKQRQIEVIDGLPAIVPHGFLDDLLKRLSTTIEAWCIVENLDKGAPFFKLKVCPADVCETKFIEQGNFYIPSSNQGKVKIIVDPKVVFGEASSWEVPEQFANNKTFKVPAKQVDQGITPAAFAYKQVKLKANGTFELNSLIGQADNLEVLQKIQQVAKQKNYFSNKAAENRQLIEGICSSAATKSASKSFDLYAQQTFLDNVMRGGLPAKLGNKILYLYYRKHGDMERDYNNFKVMPTYLSQGNGNYRDVNQNRRCDVFFNPEVAEDNVVRFFNLIQLDGYNPLVVLGSKFIIKSATTAKTLLEKHLTNFNDTILSTIINPFIIGNLLKNLENNGFQYKTSREKFAIDLLKAANTEEEAVHGEGFWIDHAFYNTDLLESFEAIYPDKVRELLFENKNFIFYDNDHIVHTREHKYELACNKVRQYVSVQSDSEKQAQITFRRRNKNAVRTKFGQGEVYHTTLIGKILCLLANKAASFDAEGIGLEMEAEKPDWYDALNGLPALLGSSLSETLELKRMAAYVLDRLPEDLEISLPTEVKTFVENINTKLAEFEADQDSFKYWDASYSLKENYRNETKLGISGQEDKIEAAVAKEFLSLIIAKCDAGIKKCLKKYHNYYTYFINEAVDYEKTTGNGIKIKKFQQKPLPLFLEGFVHALKVERDKDIPKLLKTSPLYDKKLKMYKVNASLKDAPIEIGRCKVFTPGWLENESIWLHMEYKYLLEILKAGLYKQFFAEMKNCLIPFLNPKEYKRSTLENSSFLVSSANPNADNHGRGFVARLSGACAEFLDMWVIMTTGKKMFSLDKNGKLTFKLSPILPAWLFDKKGEFSFKLFGSIEVTYNNKKKKDTFGKGVKPVSYQLTLEDGKEVEINKPTIAEPQASLIRQRKVKQIVASLA